MKNITKLSVALSLTLALAGCDFVNNVKSNTAQTQQAEQKLSAQEQFRRDYDLFEKWKLATNDSTNQEVNNLQQKILEIGLDKQLSAEEVEKLVSNLRVVIAQSIQTLDELNLKDPEITALAAKIKQNQLLVAETIDLAIQIANKSVDPKTAIPAFEQRTEMLGTLKSNIEAELNKLTQKYQQ